MLRTFCWEILLFAVVTAGRCKQALHRNLRRTHDPFKAKREIEKGALVALVTVARQLHRCRRREAEREREVHLSPPSRSSAASWMPVVAPAGTAALKVPLLVVTSHSTVGLPRLSKIWIAVNETMAGGEAFTKYWPCSPKEPHHTALASYCDCLSMPAMHMPRNCRVYLTKGKEPKCGLWFHKPGVSCRWLLII